MPIKFSLLALLVANLLPLIGVLFFAWDVVLVLALFWIENLIIGVFNLLKMVIVTVRGSHKKGLFLSVFFVLHYGLFCAAHGQLLSHLLGVEALSTETAAQSDQYGPLSLFIDAAALVTHFVNLYSPIILLGILGLIMSHLVSFIENFLLQGGILKATPDKLMGKPYKQILIMHAGLIIGAIAIQQLGSSVLLLAIIVVLKIALDLYQHRSRHDLGNSTEVTKEQIKDL